MEKNILLRLMRCPVCDNTLKVADETKKMICPACENFILPLPGTGTNGAAKQPAAALISTVSAARAFTKRFFETFDWDSFTLLQAYTVPEIDALTEKFKMAGADDKETWFLDFDSIYVPLRKKFDNMTRLNTAIIAAFRADDSVAAAEQFDAFRQLSAYLSEVRPVVFDRLTDAVDNARLCGASDADIDSMQAREEELRRIFNSALACPPMLEGFPGIRNIMTERNKEITARFAEIGVDAEAEYRRAGTCLGQKQYFEALSVFSRLRGYKNTKPLFDEVNRFYRYKEALQITGKLYILQSGDKNGAQLYEVENGRPGSSPLIRGIACLFKNYADRLYYMDIKNRIFVYDLSAHSQHEVDKKFECVDARFYESAGADVAYLSFRSNAGKGMFCLAALNLSTATINILVDDISIVHTVQDGKAVFTDSRNDTYVLSLADNERFALCHGRIEFCAFDGDMIVYCKNAPVPENKNLYIRMLLPDSQETLAEANIYSFYKVLDGCLCYTVGNNTQRSLLRMDINNRRREQILPFVKDVLLVRAGWLYVLQGDEYNTALYRLHADGSSKHLVARDVASVVDAAYGTLYYMDTDGNLCSSRLDGSEKKTLFADIDRVVSIGEGHVFFTASDDTLLHRETAGNLTVRKILSLYCMKHDGSAKQKIAFNIADVQKFDDGNIDFYKKTSISDGSGDTFLFRLDIHTLDTFKLLEFNANAKMRK